MSFISKIGFQDAKDFLAAAVRHQHIEDDHVGPLLSGAGDALDPGARLGNLQPTDAAQHLADDVAEGIFIVDHQDLAVDRGSLVGLGHRLQAAGNPEGEGRALADLALQLDVAAEQFAELPRQRQPRPVPRVSCCSAPSTWLNSSKIMVWSGGEMPMPVSVTENS